MKDEPRKQRLLRVLDGKKPVWLDKEHPELLAGTEQWVRAQDRTVLRPERASAGVRKKQGIRVFDFGEPVSLESVNNTLRKIREERESSSLGRSRVARRKKKGK